MRTGRLPARPGSELKGNRFKRRIGTRNLGTDEESVPVNRLEDGVKPVSDPYGPEV